MSADRFPAIECMDLGDTVRVYDADLTRAAGPDAPPAIWLAVDVHSTVLLSLDAATQLRDQLTVLVEGTPAGEPYTDTYDPAHSLSRALFAEWLAADDRRGRDWFLNAAVRQNLYGQRQVLELTERALRAERIPEATQARILRRVLFGDPEQNTAPTPDTKEPPG